MKRTLCFILTLLLVVSIPTISFAGNYECDYHPGASLTPHDYVAYSQEDSSYHLKSWCTDYYCSICGRNVTGLAGIQEMEPHSFFGNACIDCGYRRNNKPTQEDLQAEAIQRINKDGDKIIGMQAIVKHAGNLRCEANKYADSFRTVAEEESFEILSYTFVNGNAWLKVRYGNSSAWISASLVEISGKGDKPGEIGMRCRIIVNSGRARMRADVDSPIVEYVRYNEEYRINDVAKAPNGITWFQISVDGNRCWVSSTIVAVEGLW